MSYNDEEPKCEEMQQVIGNDELLQEHAEAHVVPWVARDTCTDEEVVHMVAIKNSLGDQRFCANWPQIKGQKSHLSSSEVAQAVRFMQGTEEPARDASSSRRRRRKGR